LRIRWPGSTAESLVSGLKNGTAQEEWGMEEMRKRCSGQGFLYPVMRVVGLPETARRCGGGKEMGRWEQAAGHWEKKPLGNRVWVSQPE
jgi:hypothetical protein